MSDFKTVEELIKLPPDEYLNYINEQLGACEGAEGQAAILKLMRDCANAAARADEPTGKMTYRQADDALGMRDSYSRLPRLLEMIDAGQITKRDFYRLLGGWWTICDNVGEYREDLLYWIGGKQIPEMMNKKERTALAALPPVVTIYRGCGPENKNGLSWSLDRDIAASFPFKERYKVQEPLLITARIRRERIIALKLDRDEQEIICSNPKRIMTESIGHLKEKIFRRLIAQHIEANNFYETA